MATTYLGDSTGSVVIGGGILGQKDILTPLTPVNGGTGILTAGPATLTVGGRSTGTGSLNGYLKRCTLYWPCTDINKCV